MIIRPGTDPEEATKIRASIEKLHQRMDDFLTLSDTIESDNPEGDAWKAVFGVDNPNFDKNTKEGKDFEARIASMLGINADSKEKIEAE